MSPLDHVYLEDVEYFQTVDLEVLQNFRSGTDDPILGEAAYEGQLDCCKEIYKRCPEQLFAVNCNGNTVFHHICHISGKMTKMLEFFLEVGTTYKAEDDIESCRNGDNTRFREFLKLRNNAGYTALSKALHLCNLETTRMWVQVDLEYELELLKIADNEKNTPLHLVVENQNLEMVDLLAVQEPKFEYGPNNKGETPLLIAMREALTGNTVSVKIRKLILERQPNQTKVRIGDKGWTSLHHATYYGDLASIKNIIRVCPDCMQVIDNEGRNFLHIAAKFEKFSVVKHVLEMTDVGDSVLNGKDNYGNSPLHMAAETGNQNMVLSFLYDRRVNKMTVNAKGQKVLDAITCDYDKEKAGVYGVRDRMNEKELKDQSDFDLVVGALIATVSFTAGITVPGGYISDGGPNSGMAMLSKSTSFEAFVISNNFALVFSLYAVFSHFCTRRLLKREDIIYQLNVATFCTLSAIFAMMVAFITGSYAVLSISNRIAITLCVNSCCFFLFAFRALLRMVMQHKHSWKLSDFSLHNFVFGSTFHIK